MKDLCYRTCIMVLYVVLLPLIAANAQESVPSLRDYYRHPPVWNHDGTRVALISDTIVEILDTQNLEQIATLAGHAGVVTSVAWNFDGSRIATGSLDETVRIWDGNTGHPQLTYTGHSSEVGSVIWSPDGTRIISSEFRRENNMHIWDAATGNLIRTSRTGTDPIMEFGPTGLEVASILGSGILIQDSHTYNWQRTFRTDILGAPENEDATNLMSSLDWSPDGAKLVTGNMGGRIYVWDVSTLTPVSILVANPHYEDDPFGVPNPDQSWVRDVTFSPDGERILAASADGTIKVWHADTFAELATQQIEPIISASWSPDAEQLFIIRPDGTYHILDTLTLLDSLPLRNGRSFP
jgi:WD40 repeat protein